MRELACSLKQILRDFIDMKNEFYVFEVEQRTMYVRLCASFSPDLSVSY